MNTLRTKKYTILVVVFIMILAVVGCDGDASDISGYSSDSDSVSVLSLESSASSYEDYSPGEEPSITEDQSNATDSGESYVSSDPESVSIGSASSSNSSVSQSKTSLTRDQVMDQMPNKLKGSTLTYFYWWNPKTQMEKEAIEAFEKKTGITVNPEVGAYTDFQSQLAANIAAGKSPDLVRLLSNAMYQVVNLQPLSNSGYDFNDTAWDADLMKNYTYNGRTYATNLKSSAIWDVGLVYYNKRALQQAEIEDPYTIWKENPTKWTWDKLFSMCDEFLKSNSGRPGYYGIGFGYDNAYIRAFGARNYDYDPGIGRWVNYMDDPELVKRYEIMVDKVNKGIIREGTSGFVQGNMLFAWHGPFPIRTGDNTFSVLKSKNYLGVVPTPTDSKYQVLYEYTAFGIPIGAKNSQAAPYYLRYVLDQQSYDMSKVWINEQAREVVDWTIAKGNFFWGENSLFELKANLFKGTPSQVKSTLNSYYGVIQEFVDKHNETIGNLQK